jgi:protein-tyrosine phosphatase
LRVPAHAAILQVLASLPGPLVLTSANPSGQEPATTADRVDRSLGDALALIVDDGPSHYGEASTVVKVNGDRLEVLRAGVVGESDLEALTPCVIVFVCTGNTCRSPLAEALCKKLLAERLGCPIEELPQRGFIVRSAGMAAMMGSKAAEEAIAVAKEMGADLSGHSSQPLTPELAAGADYLIAMTRGHCQALAGQLPRLAVAPRLLCPDGGDIADPIGCERGVYRDCARQIARSLEELLPELQQS